jgi:hypothetical protein
LGVPGDCERVSAIAAAFFRLPKGPARYGIWYASSEIVKPGHRLEVPKKRVT